MTQGGCVCGARAGRVGVGGPARVTGPGWQLQVIPLEGAEQAFVDWLTWVINLWGFGPSGFLLCILSLDSSILGIRF